MGVVSRPGDRPNRSVAVARAPLACPLMRLFSGPDKAKIPCGLPSGFLDLSKDLPAFAPYLAGGITPGSSRALRVADLDL